MGWSVVGDTYNTDSEFTGATKTCRAKMNDQFLLRYARTWIIFNNNPGLINVTMKIYSDNDNSKGYLIYSSLTTHNKADIITENNGIKEVYFEFDDIPLDANNWYHFALTGSSSGLSSSSNIAWKLSFPDPQYTKGWTQNFENMLIYPYDLVLIGSAL